VDNNIIYKNRGETFKCKFDIDGASIDDITVRLCLEFSDNKNLFFYGKIEKDGNCVIHIPKLNEVENRAGKLIVEAIVDSTYFRLYECNVELKNSVNVKINKMEGTFFNNPEPAKEPTIQLSGIERETPEPEKTKLIKEEHGEEKIVKKPKKGYSWGYKKPPKKPVIQEEIDVKTEGSVLKGWAEKAARNPYLNGKKVKEEKEIEPKRSKQRLNTFDDYINSRP